MIGRKWEQEKLQNCMKAETTQLVIVSGRRRVGKTYLLNYFFHGQYTFQITGVQDSTMEQNLKLFADQLSAYSGSPCAVPKDWYEAFLSLEKYLNTRVTDEKLVVFFDEMPWLANPAPVFMHAFEYNFPNKWPYTFYVI